VSKGRVYRRCACRDAAGKQLGQACPDLAASSKHGRWTFAVDVPSHDGRRRTMRRGGFATKKAAEAALSDVVDRHETGVKVDDRETVGQYLTAWLDDQRHALKAKTLDQFRRYVVGDLVPALGHLRLEQLRHEHVAGFVRDLEDAGRGVTTIRRIHATLSSALGDAVERRRLGHNVAQYTVLPRVKRAEVQPWTAAEAVTFLEHATGDRLGELFEVLAGSGLRIGETLALRRQDVDLDARALWIDPERGNLSDVAGRLSFTAPKTKGSAAGVGLSARVVAAFERQLARIDAERAEWGEAYRTSG
jgi:integrase